jgi:hypothetical protein
LSGCLFVRLVKTDVIGEVSSRRCAARLD